MVVSTHHMLQQQYEKAIHTLIEGLSDDGWEVRAFAARALGDIGDTRALGALIEAIDDNVDSVVAGVASALSKLNDPRAVDALVGVLGNVEICEEYVVPALVRIGEPAVEPLIENLCGNDREVRRAAAWALGDIGDKRAVEPLSWRLYDRSKHVAEACEEALEKINKNTGEGI